MRVRGMLNSRFTHARARVLAIPSVSYSTPATTRALATISQQLFDDRETRFSTVSRVIGFEHAFLN